HTSNNGRSRNVRGWRVWGREIPRAGPKTSCQSVELSASQPRGQETSPRTRRRRRRAFRKAANGRVRLRRGWQAAGSASHSSLLHAAEFIETAESNRRPPAVAVF